MPPRPSTSASASTAPQRPWQLALLPLGVALSASLVLALDHLGVLVAPGCGAESPCAQVTHGPWGTLAGTGWPTAFLGLAWFAGLIALYVAARGQLARGQRGLAALGVLGSLVLLVVMLARETVCPWCAAVHLANLLWWLLALRGRAPSEQGTRAPWLAFAGTAVLVSALLFGARAWSERRVSARAEGELARSSERILAAEGAQGFNGRWRLGPEQARARIVAFTDYQCPDCQRVEAELEAYAAAHADVSLALRHFPMCAQCNPHAPDLHPNACWAARAAESAGRLAGSEGFWRMHRWLFERSGSFTKEELVAALPELGFDAAAFTRELNSPTSLAPVEGDIELAMQLGLSRTPMIFVNGVELRGWDAPDAIRRTLDELRSKTPAAASSAADAPARAREKVLGDWRAEPARGLPVDRFPRTLGSPSAAVVIVLFGDYQDEFTTAADAAARQLALTRADVRYEYRHYPTNQACNPLMPRTIHPLACLAALGAEAAAQISEVSGFWTMHDWLMTHRVGFDDGQLLAQAKAMGIEENLWWEVLKAPELTDAIYDDVASAKELGIESIPAIYVNGKFLARWQVEGENLLPIVAQEASELR